MDLVFGLSQTKKKKDTAAKVKYTKATLKNVTITDTVETMARSNQRDRDRRYKQTKRDTKTNLRKVTQNETGEMAIRKQQAARERRWKQTGRAQIKVNSKFDMARSLYGGCGDPAVTDYYSCAGSERLPNVSYHEKEIQRDDYYEQVITDYYDEEDYYEEEITDFSEEYMEEVIVVVDKDALMRG